MTTDGEDGLSKRQLVAAAQDQATKELLAEMKGERDALIADFEKDELKGLMLIKGIEKVCVTGMIKYHQMRHILFEEVALHPEMQKGLEILHYHVENNLPVEKELVYQLVPELYTH